MSAGLCFLGLEAVDPALESVPLYSVFKSKKASVAPLLIVGFIHLRFLKKKLFAIITVFTLRLY